MASSGSFNTSGYATDYGTACLTFAWSIKSQDPATNQTVINWSVKGAGLDSGHYIKAGGFKVIINGQTVYSKSTDYRIELYTGTVVASGTATITHNTDGTKTFSASVEAGIYYYAVNCSGSGSWALTTIPRYAKITTFKVASKTETTATITWGCDVGCDKIQYSLNGGSWKDASGYPNFKITGLTYDTDYSVKIRVRRTDSQLTTDSSAVSFRTYDYPHCIEAPKFVIGEPVSLGFFNPLGRTFTFSIVANGVTITHDDWTISGTSYYGLDDESIQTALYDSIPDREYASYYVNVTYGDSVRKYAVFDGYRVDPDVCSPTFSNFEYYDGEQLTAEEITGNNQIMVKGWSNLVVKIPTEDLMVALNGALPDKYTMTIDKLSASVDDRDEAIEHAIGTIAAAGVLRLSVTAYDSRGLHKTAYKDITVIEYDEPVINANIKRLNNFEAETTLKVSGTYSRVTIEDSDRNNITKVQYRYRETGGEWGGWTTLTTTLMSGDFTCNDVVLSLDNSKSFEFEIRAIDLLGMTVLTAPVDIGQAIFFISTNKKACYINGVEVPTLDTVYPIGSVYCSSANINPSEIYGGTWELIDKGFKAGITGGTQEATSLLTAFTVNSVRGGNTIRLRISCVTALAFGDTTATLGTIDLATHGLTAIEGAFFSYNVYGGVAMSDGSNAVILLNLLTDGQLQMTDSFTSDGVHSLPSGTPFYFDVTLPVTPDNMADDFCDKFYWQRTA